MFTTGGKHLKNKVWQQHNISQLGQVISDGKMIPFNDLKLQFGLMDTEFLSYLQIKSVMKTLLSKDIGNKKDLENILRAVRKGTASAMYNHYVLLLCQGYLGLL